MEPIVKSTISVLIWNWLTDIEHRNGKRIPWWQRHIVLCVLGVCLIAGNGILIMGTIGQPRYDDGVPPENYFTEVWGGFLSFAWPLLILVIPFCIWRYFVAERRWASATVSEPSREVEYIEHDRL